MQSTTIPSEVYANAPAVLTAQVRKPRRAKRAADGLNAGPIRAPLRKDPA